jgi:hypothetical protein
LGVYPLGNRLLSVTFQKRFNERLNFNVWFKLFNPLQEFASVPKDRLKNVTFVEGDMAKAGLGLSTDHRGLLISSHISIVFHVAASVSFQDTLLETLQTNTWPAIEVVRLCQAMPDVKVKKPENVCAPVMCENVHICNVCGLSYLFIADARLFAEQPAVC